MADGALVLLLMVACSKRNTFVEEAPAWADGEAAVSFAISPRFRDEIETLVPALKQDDASFARLSSQSFFRDLLTYLLRTSEAQLHLGYEPALPTLVFFSSTKEGTPAAPVSRLLQGVVSFGEPRPPQFLAKAFLPAKDPAALVDHLRRRWRLGEIHACTATNKTIVCELDTPSPHYGALVLREQSALVEVDLLLGAYRPGATQEDHRRGLFDSEEALTPQMFAEAADDLRRSKAVVLAYAKPRLLSNLFSSYLLHSFEDGSVQIGAVRTFIHSELLARSGLLFLPSRTEIASWRLALAIDDGILLSAEAVLSTLGAAVVERGVQAREAKDGFNLTKAVAEADAASWLCPGRTTSCTMSKENHCESTEQTWIAALQSPLLLARSLSTSLPRNCPVEQSALSMLWEELGLSDVRLWRDTNDEGRAARFRSRLQETRTTMVGRLRQAPGGRVQVQVRLSETEIAAQDARFPPWPTAEWGKKRREVATVEGKGWACLEAGAAEVAKMLYSCPTRVLHAKTADLAPQAKEAQELLKCALSAPETRLSARAWDEALTMFRAERAHARLQIQQQIDLLKEGCRKGYQRACSEVRAAEHLRGVELAMTPCPCALDLAATFEQRCTDNMEPWWAPRINGMDRHGRVDSSVPSFMMAIDRRATVRDVRKLLEGGGPGTPREFQYRNVPKGEEALRPVLSRGDGAVVYLGHMGLAMSRPCWGQRLIHHYVLSGQEQELREKSAEAVNCGQGPGDRVNHTFDFPDDTSWSSAIVKICEVQCAAGSDGSYDLLSKDPP